MTTPPSLVDLRWEVAGEKFAAPFTKAFGVLWSPTTAMDDLKSMGFSIRSCQPGEAQRWRLSRLQPSMG